MTILVINGSPKGKNSITYQTVLYLQKHHPEHTFDVLHVGQKIKALEKDFSSALTALSNADLLLFSYPVYTFIAPCQMHRFIELVKQNDVNLSEKYAAQITTSKHFYDVTAHRYIQDNCHDLGLKYIAGLSADMDDLTTEKGQKEAEDFFSYLCWSVSGDHYLPLPAPQPSAARHTVDVPHVNSDKKGDVVIITDCHPEDMQLQRMIERFRAVFPRNTRIFNLREFHFNGGCLG